MPATTNKGKIVFLGNVLPIHENPVRVAEEVSMVDIMSGGRVVCGFVRGIGQESMATNTNPVYNRERFDEAHDVIVKTWTTPGPFRWEGKHFQYRIVNPWMMPLQKPHPPIWIPGVASPESVIWAARHGYPYVALAPSIELLRGIYDLYAATAEEEGYTATPDNRGYAIRVACADTDEEAYELGRNWYWQLGTSFGIAPRHWQAPPRLPDPGQPSRVLASRNATPPAKSTSLPAAPSSNTNKPKRPIRLSPATPTP